MKKPLAIGIVTALVIGTASFAVAGNRQNADPVPVSMQEQAVSAPEPATAPAAEPAPAQAATAGYVDYVSLENAPADRPHRVLFFKADWCYTCTGLHKDIEANSTSVPADVQIIRVNYDKETSLKQKYDVRQQHTMVQIDQDGNVVKKWVLSPTLKDVAAQIERT